MLEKGKSLISLLAEIRKKHCIKVLKREDVELVVNKLRAYDDVYYAKIIKKLNSMRFYMENNLDARRFYLPDPIIRKGLEDVMINAENLPRVMYQLKEKYPEKFELLKDVYVQLFPEIANVIVRQFELNNSENEKLPENIPFVIANSIYVLYVEDKNLRHSIGFKMMSDSVKRVFMILARIILSETSNVSLIAIEEPENSVHLGLLQAYIRIISQLLNDCKIIITSHSPYIVSYMEPSWIYVRMNRKPGVAEFFTFKKSGQKLLQQDAESFKMSMETEVVFYKQVIANARKKRNNGRCDVSIECKNVSGVGGFKNIALRKFIKEIKIKYDKDRKCIVVLCRDTDVFEFSSKQPIRWDEVERDMDQVGAAKVIHVCAKRSIEDWLLYDIEGIKRFLRLPKKTKPSGKNGYETLKHLYKSANKMYYKGMKSNGMIHKLDIDKIANTVKDQLQSLYEVLGVDISKRK